MKEIEMVALDIDGTLLDDKGNISCENIKALNKLSKKGVMIVLSSGRMTDCVSPFANKLGIDCPLIIYNGAMVRAKKREKRKIIYHNPLPSKYSDLVVEHCIKNRFHLNFYLNDILYGQKDKSLKKYASIYSNQTKAKFHFLKDLGKLKGSSSTKLILITDVYNQNKFRTRDFQYNYFSKIFGNKVTLFKTNPEYLEFLNKDVDKGVGLEKLVNFYGIERKKIIAFGDGENDIAMLEFAGIGVALSNAKKKVKKVADFISDYDNNNSAIAKFLYKYCK